MDKKRGSLERKDWDEAMEVCNDLKLEFQKAMQAFPEQENEK